MNDGCRRLVVAFLLMLIGVSCAADTTPEEGFGPMEGDLFVATHGDDTSPGTADRPWRTIGHALEQISAGDHLVVGGGIYRERLVDVSMPDASPPTPTVIRAADGQRVVIEGLLWLRGGRHWVLDGIDVTWDPSSNGPDEHMVKVTDGTDWTVRNGVFFGARSYAGMLVAGTRDGEPARWEVLGNCIRDTFPTNDVNQDHNLYVNTGLSAGEGRIEGNVLVGARNGDNLKLGPPGRHGGSVNVLVRHNTLHRAVQNLVLSGESSSNRIEGNILSSTSEGNASIREYELSGTGNVVRGNLGYATTAIIDPSILESGHGIEDGGGNRSSTDPGFGDEHGCDGLVPDDATAKAYGHQAWDGAGDH